MWYSSGTADEGLNPGSEKPGDGKGALNMLERGSAALPVDGLELVLGGEARWMPLLFCWMYEDGLLDGYCPPPPPAGDCWLLYMDASSGV